MKEASSSQQKSKQNNTPNPPLLTKGKKNLGSVFLPAAMLPSYMHRYLNKQTNSMCLAQSLK